MLQDVDYADYVDLMRMLLSVIVGWNGGKRAIKDYETMCTDDFYQVGKIGLWVCEKGVHKATLALNRDLIRRSPYLILDHGLIKGIIEMCRCRKLTAL